MISQSELISLSSLTNPVTIFQVLYEISKTSLHARKQGWESLISLIEFKICFYFKTYRTLQLAISELITVIFLVPRQ